MSSDNEVIIRRLYEEFWNRRKLEVVNELLSPSHALQVSDMSGSATGPEAYKRQFNRWLAGFPDLHLTIQDTIGENEKMAVAWTISGTHRGEFWGVAPTNKEVSVDGITIHHIANGKIMDSYANWDSLGLMQQLGVATIPGQPKGASAR